MTDLNRLASLIRSRNTVDNNIANLIGDSVNMQTVASYIASVIFGIEYADSPTTRESIARFTHGPLSGHSVDIQWHTRRDGRLELDTTPSFDYYLVFTGPKAEGSALRPIVNLWIIEYVFLFDAKELLQALHERGIQIGNRINVISELWDRAEIYPAQQNNRLILSGEQRQLLARFH